MRPRRQSSSPVVPEYPPEFYHRFARYLAARGAAVLSFDYRGIGASREGSLRNLKAGMDDWAVQDLGAALAEARTTYPRLPLSAVAHSIGTLYVGATPDASRLSKLVFFGPHHRLLARLRTATGVG